MKAYVSILATVALVSLSACGETGESADIDMSADTVEAGAGTGGAEGPASLNTPTPGEMVTPAPEPFAPMDAQPTATPAPATDTPAQ